MPETRLQISPLVYIGGLIAFLMLGTMIALLVMQLTVLRDSQQHIAAQDAKITKLQAQLDPALREVKPAADELTPLLREARGLVDPVRGSADSVTQAADLLPTTLTNASTALADLSVLIDAATPLVQEALPLVRDTLPLVRALNATDAPAALSAVGRFARVADDQQIVFRLARVLERVPTFERLLTRVDRVLRRTVRIQLKTLRTQERTLRLFFRSIAIQEEVLGHVRSIDQKFGGTPPVAPPTR